MTPADPISVAAALGAILDEIGIRYVIGGSVASSLFGEPRSTLDLDIMIEAGEKELRLLVRQLQDDFHADEDAAIEAFGRGAAFNAIHYGSSLKVDFFPAENEQFAASQLDRRREVRLVPGGPPLYFYSPEDLIVRKLMWFRSGGQVSERQWRDVLGILKARSGDLDLGLLRSAAAETGVAELLRRALSDSA